MAANSSGHQSKLLGVGSLSGGHQKLQHASVAHSHQAAGAQKFKGHQRRQSVARLLPDISKLRLLSWLVEASSELIDCDIAIMDGVYAKLNRSRESLLFWTSGSGQQPAGASYRSPHQYTSNYQQLQQQPPPMPSAAPVGATSKSVISRCPQKKQAVASACKSSDACSLTKRSRQKKNQRFVAAAGEARRLSTEASRNHHSLPLPNYLNSNNSDNTSVATNSSLAAAIRPAKRNKETNQSSLRSAAGSLLFPNRRQRDSRQDSCSLPGVSPAGKRGRKASASGRQQEFGVNDDETEAEELEMEEDEDDDDNHSSAESSTTSSGIHGGEASISSDSSVSSSSNSSSISDSSSCSLGSDLVSASMVAMPVTSTKFNVPFPNEVNPNLSSAEQLSEKIRRTVMEHNYLQNLLVNVIRQHDRRRQSLNRQRNRNNNGNKYNSNGSITADLQQLKIDLADIADSLDDGCLCSCHSQPQLQYQRQQKQQQQDPDQTPARSSTLPAISSSSGVQVANSPATIQVPARKARGLKKLRAGSNNQATSSELSRQDIINQLGGRLCENCFETHYWLHGCSIELTQQQQHLQQLLNEKLAIREQQQRQRDLDLRQQASTDEGADNLSSAATSKNNNQANGASSSAATSDNSKISSMDIEDLNAIITIKNATFIKLIQQQVRSTISKSIELIDLIRKEIKSPESIKQKQLMKCFSTSIQLLTSVGNYVVPTQDISTFIPEVGQQQTTLFCLPPSDFDHLLIYPSNTSSLPANQRNAQLISGGTTTSNQYHLAAAPEIPLRRGSGRLSNQQPASLIGPVDGKSMQFRGSRTSAEHELSADLQRLRTTDDPQSLVSTASSVPSVSLTTGGAESSSGASSNNSSASSSIARGTVQQSSLIRAHTSSAILDPSGGGGCGADGATNGSNSTAASQHDPLSSFEAIANLSRQHTEDDMLFQSNRQTKFWQSSKFNFIKKLLHVKEQRLLRQQSKDRRIYNNKVQNKFRLVMRDLTHFNKSQQMLTTENGVNSLLTSMRNVLEFGLYLTLKLY